MSESAYFTIDGVRLAAKLVRASPANDSREEGLALVHVSSRDHFLRERIPGSMNIPHDAVREFEKHFDRSKEIVVYGRSRECGAAEKVARQLAAAGFERVLLFVGGLREWRDAGHPLAGTSHP